MARLRVNNTMIHRITVLLALTLATLLSTVSPAWAHDTAVSGIRVLYRRHDVVVSVTTALSRLSKAEGWTEAGGTSEAVDRAIRRRLKLQFDGKARILPKANVISDWASDLLCWQTVLALPVRNVKALGSLYPEDPASNTILTVLRDGQAVEETLLTARQYRLAAGNRAATQAAFGWKELFTRSVATHRLTLSVILLAVGMAFLFGALHALSPGHGKTMVAAALVGTRGTAWHAILLGAVVTLTHTVGVFALGLITLSATPVIPERLYPILTALSGGMIVCVGVSIVAKQFRKRHHAPELRDPYEDDEAEEEAYAAPALDTKLSLRSLVVLGITGGAVPCPSALVVMLSAIALHRVAFGLVLILAFSLGLAVVLTGIGLMVVRLGSALERLPWNARLIARLPMFSAATILLTGVGFLVRAFQGGF